LTPILNLRMRSIDLGMMNTDDPSIPKSFISITCFILVRWWSPNHDIRAVGKMYQVWFPANVVWRVIKAAGLNWVYLVAQNPDGLAFRRCECPVIVSIEVVSKQPTKKVLLELWQKVL
jgi:hypothetical protein